MFPQSELDTYKLKVELLQEKLQKSEISRQQLQHKLDKLLQKRDDHDKMVRAKAKQKYQQFLEEQQRRNERNKQLIQMLEHIEHQTQAMNARSERLKMMKLQYEMYFANLVHSQTRRCIQDSVIPMRQMVPTATLPFAEGYNYVANMEKPIHLRPQQENVALQMTETPTLENFVKAKIDYANFGNENIVSSMQEQQMHENATKCETINNNVETPMKKQEITDDISKSVDNIGNWFSSPPTNSLPNDKYFTASKVNSNVSTVSGELQNVVTVPLSRCNSNEIPNTSAMSANIYKNATIAIDKGNNTANFRPSSKSHNSDEEPLQFPDENFKHSDKNSISQDVAQDIKDGIAAVNKANELNDVRIAKPYEKPLASLEPLKTVIETSNNSADNKIIANKQRTPVENSLKNNTQSNSFQTPTSIENIENEIYGELLSPLEAQEVTKTENSHVTQNLLQNLVTQPENLDIENMPFEEKNIISEANAITDTTATIEKEQNQVTSDYEYPDAYDNYGNNGNNDQEPTELANNITDYTNYENVIGGTQQQQGEYDYSNYDPTQYSYPGYIYDETTGEYKPDPSATVEQYATDQQYSAEGYDQQYQQQNYDYNQTYTEHPTIPSATAEDPPYNTYDTSQPIVPSNFTPSDTNTEQEQTTTNLESNVLQPDVTTEEVPTTSTKVAKPTSILSTTDKNDSQKKKKRVNFIDSSETDESATGEKVAAIKSPNRNLSGSSESDFDFSSRTDAEAKTT